MTKSEFFCVCEEDGSIEWVETIKDREGNETERVNELTKEGEMKIPWKMDIYVYNKFSDMNINQARFYEKRKLFNEKYEDLFCFSCEKRLKPIPFRDIDKQQRIDIFKMNFQERIDFAKNYKMVKVLEK